jgi:hypothetical protein
MEVVMNSMALEPFSTPCYQKLPQATTLTSKLRKTADMQNWVFDFVVIKVLKNTGIIKIGLKLKRNKKTIIRK